jgi:hypothetical protein
VTHKCLACSGQIGEDQDEEMIPGQDVRSMHTHWEDCEKALSGRSGRSAAQRSERIRKRRGHVVNMPGLDDMEEWD